jgi:very-short-patch-repair endonuclease
MERKHNKMLTENAKILRNNMTKEEKHLWYDYLRKCPVRFSRQKVLGKYIADFYSAEAKLVIELDGAQHFEKENRIYDEKRTEFLEQYDLKIIRIPNGEINTNFEGICRYLDKQIEQSLSQLR